MGGKQYDDDYEWIQYDRISDDREGSGKGVKRQNEDGQELVDRLGGKVIASCVDNDMTANDRSRRYKPRPEYERLCALLRERPGRRGVITWHTDRLHRSPRELEDFIDLVEETGAAVHTVKAGPIDLSTPSGRMIARQLCAVARFESEHKATRIKRKVEELATEGKIANGGPRPFGYTRIYAGEGPRRKILRDEIDPAEAAIIRECARRVLDGDSLGTIIKDLNARGVKTSTAGQPRRDRDGQTRKNADGTPEISSGLWTKQALRWLLRSGRIAGLREHKGVVVGQAVWPAIIDKETHEQLRAILDSNQRPVGSRVRLHYLSGYVFCDRCYERGIKMRVKAHHHKLKYTCPPKSEGGCSGRVIGLAELEGFVGKYMVGRLSDPAALAELAQREAAEDEEAHALVEAIESDERRLALLQASLTDGDENEMPEVLASMRVIRQRMTRARGHLASRTRTPALGGDSLPDLAARWPALPLERKRGLLALFVDRITIGPAVRGVARFDPDRVDIVPRRLGEPMLS